MATLQEFKNLQASVGSTEQAEIAELYITNRESAVSKMIGIAWKKSEWQKISAICIKGK